MRYLSLSDAVAQVGKVATFPAGSLRVRVKLLDAKVSYGALRYKITPVAGTGEQWADAANLTLED